MPRKKGSVSKLKKREFPQGSGIYIAETFNRSGGSVYGSSFQVVVSAKLTGKDRIRKQFNLVEKAEEFAKEEAPLNSMVVSISP